MTRRSLLAVLCAAPKAASPRRTSGVPRIATVCVFERGKMTPVRYITYDLDHDINIYF